MLENLKSFEGKNHLFYDIQIKSEMMNDESAFCVSMIHNSFKIRTNLNNQRKHLDMLFMIADHLFTIYSHINRDFVQNDVYILILSDKMINDYEYGINHFFGEDSPNEYDGEDYQDILKKFNYSSLIMNPNEYELFFNSLNNVDLMNVMKLVSYYHGYPDEALLFFNTSEETDSSKIFDINRLQMMIDELYQIMEERGSTIRSKKLLNICLYELITHKKKDKILAFFEEYGYDYIDLPESTFREIIYCRMNDVILKMIFNSKIDIYQWNKTMLFSNGYMIENYDRILNILTSEYQLEESEKNILHKMVLNIRFMKMIAMKEFDKLSEYLNQNPMVYTIPTSFLLEMIKVNQIELVHRLFSENLIDFDIFEKRHFNEIFIMYTTKEMFKTILPYLSYDKILTVKMSDFYMCHIKDMDEKREFLRIHLSDQLPLHSFQMDIKYQISSFMV